MLFGSIAVFIARGWIQTAIEAEFQTTVNLAEAVKPDVPDMVPVVVVKSDHVFGDVLTPDLLRVVDMPKNAVPESAFARIDNVFFDGKFTTFVVSDLVENEILLPHKISAPGSTGSLSSMLSEGMRAVTVRVNDVAGVGGFVMPGDRVDIIYTWDEDSRRNGNTLQSSVFLQSIRVLGIDQNMNVNTSDPNVAKTVTLEVSPNDAQRLQLAQDTGRLGLTLRALGDVEENTVSTLKQDTIITSAPRPAPTRKASTREAKPPSSTAAITIVRGEQRDQVNVFNESVSSTRDGRGG